MKIICTQENLKNGLALVGKISSNNTTLPILNNILFKTENGMLSLSATNLEVGIITQIRCKVEEEGEVSVNSRTLGDLVTNLPNKNLTLASKSGALEIDTENYHSSIKTLPAEDFPLIPLVDKKQSFTLEAQEIRQAFSQVVFAVSNNQSQPEISGVLLSFSENGLKIVATDRYRLAEKRLPFSRNDINQEIILPQRAIGEISRIISSSEGQVEIGFGGSQAAFIFKDTTIITRLVDGQYPPYSQIIPTSFNTEIICLRQSLVSGLRAGGIFSQNGNSVNMQYDTETQKLTLVSESGDLGANRVEIESEIKGAGGALVVNYHYLLDCLMNMNAEKVILKIVDDSSPALVLPFGDESYTYLVMPIKI